MARTKGALNKPKETLYTLSSIKCSCKVKTGIKSMIGTCGAHGNMLEYNAR